MSSIDYLIEKRRKRKEKKKIQNKINSHKRELLSKWKKIDEDWFVFDKSLDDVLNSIHGYFNCNDDDEKVDEFVKKLRENMDLINESSEYVTGFLELFPYPYSDSDSDLDQINYL